MTDTNKQSAGDLHAKIKMLEMIEDLCNANIHTKITWSDFRRKLLEAIAIADQAGVWQACKSSTATFEPVEGLIGYAAPAERTQQEALTDCGEYGHDKGVCGNAQCCPSAADCSVPMQPSDNDGECQSCVGGMCTTGPECVTLGRDVDPPMKQGGNEPCAAPTQADAWLFTCKGDGKWMQYATIDEDDTNHWPLDQWKSVVKSPLVLAAAPATAVDAVGAFAIEVEKLILSKLGRAWTPGGISIVSLIDELAERAAAPTQAGGEPDGYLEHAPMGDFLAYGTTTKNPQTALYSLDKARAILAAAPAAEERKPLTPEEIDKVWHGMGSFFTSDNHRIFARAIERAHGIGDNQPQAD